MNLLLDTSTFLWLTGVPEKLSMQAADACQSPTNTLFLSPISTWEIELKYRKGKLHLAQEPRLFIPTQRTAHHIAELPFDEAAALEYSTLPNIHKDPFDRMLICQALAHGLTIITSDKAMRAYPVATIW